MINLKYIYIGSYVSCHSIKTFIKQVQETLFSKTFNICGTSFI